jgi:hypothetical protein
MSHIKSTVANQFGSLDIMRDLFGSFTTVKTWMSKLESMSRRYSFHGYDDKTDTEAWNTFKGDMFEHLAFEFINHYGNNKFDIPFGSPELLDRAQRGFDIKALNRDGLTTWIQCKYQRNTSAPVKAENLDQMFIEHGAHVRDTYHNEMRELMQTDPAKFDRLMTKSGSELESSMYVITTAKGLKWRYAAQGVKCIGITELIRYADGDESFAEKLKQSC